MEKKVIYCGISNYKLTGEGKVPYEPSEEEKVDFIRMMKEHAPTDSEIVYMDENPFPLGNWVSMVEPQQPISRSRVDVTPEPPLSNHEINCFRLDENDLDLLKLLKNKYVKSQLYETASVLRDIEKDLIIKLEYARLKRERERHKEQEEKDRLAKEFSDFLLENYTACHWFENKNPKENPKKLYGYTKNSDPQAGTYSTDQVYELFALYQFRKSFKKD